MERTNVRTCEREVKVVMFLEKARNPFAAMVSWLERSRGVRFNGE
jgi:hypothetical protein